MRLTLPAILVSTTAAAGIVLTVAWPGEAPQSAQALTVERAVAASIPQWPAPGQCVLVEAVLPADEGSDSGLPIQRPYEICHRIGYPESDDPGAYYRERVTIECRQAARDLCGLGVDAGERPPDEQRAAQQCSQLAQAQCAEAARLVGASPWMSEPYPWVAQPAIRRINRPGAIWRAHGCVCKGAGACKYWPGQGEDAGVTVPPATTVPAATVSGAGCVDTPCSETEVREASGPQMAEECRQ